MWNDGEININEDAGYIITDNSILNDISNLTINVIDNNNISMALKDISLTKKYEISLNVGNESVTFKTDEIIENGTNISNYSYRGFKLAINRIWGDDPSINQLIIFNENDNPVVSVDGDTDDEDFSVSNLTANSSIVAAINVYGYTWSEPIAAAQLLNFFNTFIDNVIYAQNGNINDIATIRSNFYDNTIFHYRGLPCWARYGYYSSSKSIPKIAQPFVITL